ncbi:hypothetical protein E3N88_09723 [Mikania micrantha]|uniref:CCHC-type domain-containing protein n=1 Tax=Mikania micrantha TaxID=192012 RepID=A0A5N6PKR5_9ASTR|nr:hypothetical protein E3N88_09723 [Mikania micrantha]
MVDVRCKPLVDLVYNEELDIHKVVQTDSLSDLNPSTSTCSDEDDVPVKPVKENQALKIKKQNKKTKKHSTVFVKAKNTGNISSDEYVTCPSDKSERGRSKERKVNFSGKQAKPQSNKYVGTSKSSPSVDQSSAFIKRNQQLQSFKNQITCLMCGESSHFAADCFFNPIKRSVSRKEDRGRKKSWSKSSMSSEVNTSDSRKKQNQKASEEDDFRVELPIASRQILAESTSTQNDVSQSETINTSQAGPSIESASDLQHQEEVGSPSVEENTLETTTPRENQPTTVQILNPHDLPEIQLEVVLPNLESINLDVGSQIDVIPRTCVHNTYPVENIIGNVEEGVRTRRSMHEANICLFSCFLSQIEPKKVAEALKDNSWVEAMQEELLQFERQGVWKTCPLPKGRYAIGTKWVFRNKKYDKGIVIKNKGRLVVQGYTQEEGIDYDEVFAPVARIEAIRIFLAFAAAKDFKVFQMDVKSAFLYGKIDEEVYVCQPPGFEDPKFPDHVCKLDKALYGLHQAPRKWYETLSSFLLANNFKRGTIDKTLFFKKSNQHIMLVQIYVDDIIFGSTNESLCKDFESLMKSKFEMSSMGELTFFLGLQVKQTSTGIFISQSKYVKDILDRFKLSDCKALGTPMSKTTSLSPDLEGEDVDQHQYRAMIGSLMYLTASRPDIIREAKFIQKIVTKISLKLHLINWSIDEKLVGMEERVKNVISSLEVESADDVRMIGIWGMGGAGKTTLARAVCDHISIWFEGKSFVENVRERSKGGLRELQRQLLKDVLNDQSIDITGVFDGINKMKKMMPGRKVLVVLDDVDHIEHLEALAGELTWFKPGSRIFITTRDKQVLVAQGVHVDNIYNISLLSDEEAICLFSRTEPIWLETLERLKTIPLEETLKKLEISYDGLEKEYKEIFLDIACILKDEQKNKAIRILESCGFHAQIGLEVLEQKSLINISYNGYLGMHDHIEEMSRNIVRRLHPGEPNRHSRLWVKEEIREILVNDLGTKATRSMILKHMDINPAVVMKSLRKMKKIKLLYVNDNKVFPYRVFGQIDVGGVQYLPDTLRCLIWADYPFFRLPKTFQANNLVYLKMPRSCISQLWEGGERKVLKKLKFVDLSYSNLRTFDLGMTRNLETLDLRSCIGLVEHQMPVPLPMLKDLNLCGSKVSNLNLEMTPNLKVLKLMDCYYLQEIHAPVGCLKYLTRLNLSGCLRFDKHLWLTLEGCIPELPKDLWKLESLEQLTLCMDKIKHLPDNICMLKHLKSLELRCCLRLEQLPMDLGGLECLEELRLTYWTSIRDIPDSICQLKSYILKSKNDFVKGFKSGGVISKFLNLGDPNF